MDTTLAAPARRADSAGRLPLGLLLALANFAIGIGAFVVVGLAVPLAQDLGVATARSGWLLTVYAAVYALGSPLGVALTGRWSRRGVLVAGLALFSLGAAAAALAPGFATVLLARGLMALGAGLVTPVAAAVAVALAAPEARGRALALVFGGLTLAQAVGVPFGAWLGYAYRWRVAFGFVALLALAVALLLAWRVPASVAVPGASLAALREVLRSPRQRWAVAYTALFVAALYTLYTFLAALAAEHHGLGRDGVTALLVLFGLGAVIGNGLGGRLADRIGAGRTLALLALSQVLLLPLLTLAPLSLPLFAAGVGLWSVFSWSFMAPQQARLAGLGPDRVPVLFALNAAALYVGGSVGSALGSALLPLGGYGALGPLGAAIALVAWASLKRTDAASH
jgi:MFS transporter, DHA1 family, inner membrane transport protein